MIRIIMTSSQVIARKPPESLVSWRTPRPEAGAS